MNKGIEAITDLDPPETLVPVVVVEVDTFFAFFCSPVSVSTHRLIVPSSQPAHCQAPNAPIAMDATAASDSNVTKRKARRRATMMTKDVTRG
jgi:hypothetical protein